jgi:hypothetical protein
MRLTRLVVAVFPLLALARGNAAPAQKRAKAAGIAAK